MHDSHQKAAEYHNLAAQAHRTAAVHHGQEEHLTGMSTPDKPWSTQIRRINTHWGCIRRP